MKISKTKLNKQRVVAANVFEDDADMDFGGADDELATQLDDIQDQIEDVQDTVNDIEEDGVDIDIDNNITNHLIAECENCHEIFISAMVDSNQDVESISGVCPLCNKETTQQLKWIVKDYPEN